MAAADGLGGAAGAAGELALIDQFHARRCEVGRRVAPVTAVAPEILVVPHVLANRHAHALAGRVVADLVGKIPVHLAGPGHASAPAIGISLSCNHGVKAAQVQGAFQALKVAEIGVERVDRG